MPVILLLPLWLVWANVEVQLKLRSGYWNVDQSKSRLDDAICDIN